MREIERDHGDDGTGVARERERETIGRKEQERDRPLTEWRRRTKRGRDFGTN